MSRRTTLLVLLAVGLLTGPAPAQGAAKLPRVGLLMGGTPASTAPLVAAFRQGLRDLGYVGGQNVALELRYAEGRAERLPGLAAELVRQKVELVVTGNPAAARAAQQATGTIPIVFAAVGDPVAEGFVASLARPGGNLTGLSPMSPDLVGKQLELLKETVPRLSRVAVLRDPAHPDHPPMVRQAEGAVRALGLRLALIDAGSADALDGAFRRMAAERVGSALVLRHWRFLQLRARIADLAAQAALPTMFGHREEAEAGGLMSYGANTEALFRRAGTYVDKILKGAKPTDLPVEQPMKFELVVNLKTARALGLTFPPSILIRADQVIQ